MESSTPLYSKDATRKLAGYKFWGTAIVICLVAVVIVLIGQQKLQNDQVELTQPDDSFVFEGHLASLPNLGQTFVPRQAGLRGIYLPLTIEKNNSPDAALTLHLRSSPEAARDIRTVTLSLAELENRSLARFSFEPLPDSFNTRYYFLIEPVPGQGQAEVKFYYGGPTTYIDGGLYLDGQPKEFQANFFLAYDRSLILRDWGWWLVKNGLNLLALVLLTILPGGAGLIWLWPKNWSEIFGRIERFNHIEWLALAAGLSVAIYPVLLLLANLVGLKLNSAVIITLLGISLVAIIAGAYYRQQLISDGSLFLWQPIQTLSSPPILLFWLIFGLAAAVRILVVRGQEAPLWPDSYHHAVISQLLADHGGLFDSWAPYAPLKSFSYHFGFHAFVAVYHWLTGAGILPAILVVGQLLNLLSVPVAFLLGRRLGGSEWAGTFAALITGLLSEYPMFYINWGRYPQLAGQVILPVSMLLTWLVLKAHKVDYKLVGLACLSVAGLALTHYRILFFYLGFVIPLLGLQWLQSRWQLPTLWQQSLRVGMIGLGSILIITPWLWRVIGSRLWQVNASMVATGSSNEFIQVLLNSSPSVFDFVLPPVVILGMIGLIWGSWQREEGILLAGSWGIILLILANPHFLNLPGTGVINYFTVLIAGYLFFSILAGFTLAKVTQAFISLSPRFNWGIVLVTLGIGLIGAQTRVSSFKPDNTMVTKPDLAAMTWIRENTSPEAMFWVNSRLAYGDSSVVGTDAGWWIPLLAHRRGLVLPMIYGTELNDPVDYPVQIRQLYQQIQRAEADPAQLWQALQQAGVTHIYIGQRRGEVWRGTEQPLNPVAFQSNPRYRLVYRQDQVWIFELN